MEVVMGKYNIYAKKSDGKPRRTVHPVWRGIGFLMIILIPIISFAATLVLLQENAKNGWFSIPADLYIYKIQLVSIPSTKDFMYEQNVRDPLIIVKLLITGLFSIALFGVFSMVNFAMYGAFGPPRYGPLDVPPTAYKGKAYKR
jgi:hypothetical protein